MPPKPRTQAGYPTGWKPGTVVPKKAAPAPKKSPPVAPKRTPPKRSNAGAGALAGNRMDRAGINSQLIRQMLDQVRGNQRAAGRPEEVIYGSEQRPRRAPGPARPNPFPPQGGDRTNGDIYYPDPPGETFPGSGGPDPGGPMEPTSPWPETGRPDPTTWPDTGGTVGETYSPENTILVQQYSPPGWQPGMGPIPGNNYLPPGWDTGGGRILWTEYPEWFDPNLIRMRH